MKSGWPRAFLNMLLRCAIKENLQKKSCSQCRIATGAAFLMHSYYDWISAVEVSSEEVSAADVSSVLSVIFSEGASASSKEVSL